MLLATTGGGVLFQTDVLFSNLGYFAVNLRIFLCTFTGLNNAVVSQNLQVSGMAISTNKGMFKLYEY